MIKTKINPFKPNSPVPTAMFAGRYHEIITLEKGLFQTKNNQPVHFMITGDRGIGKSSLMLYLKHVSDGSVESVEHGMFNFVPINLTVSDSLDILTLIKLSERHLSRELGKTETIRKFMLDTWDFVQRISSFYSAICILIL